MEEVEEIQASPRILQVAHGRIIPQFVSAYSLRCHSLIKKSKRTLISFAGAIFKDENLGYSEQYRSLLVTGVSFIRGDRALEIYISRGRYLRKKYLKRLSESVRNSDIIIFEGPWQYPLVKGLIDDKFVVYDAHNVEYSLREGNRFQEECKAIEGSLLDRANIVLAVTNRDMKIFKATYGVGDSKLFFCPHTVNISGIRWKGPQSNHVVFIGSIFAANNSALLRIYELAKIFPDFIFDIIGSVKGQRKPKLKNLVMHGTVEDSVKDEIMSNAFVALNPVTEGSGRNVKMVDYLAHGLPIISTPVGTRGFENFNISEALIATDINNFGHYLRMLCEDRIKLESMSDAASKLYQEIIKAEDKINPEEIILSAYRSRTKNNK